MTEEEEDMDASSILKRIKNIQMAVIDYLDEEKDQDDDMIIKQINDKLKELKNDFDIKEILHLLRSIIYNHHRNPHFYSRIELLIKFLKNEIKQTFSNSYLFNFFSENPRIILFLIENNIIKIDEPILKTLSKPSNVNYFFPEIESFYVGHSMKFEGENQTNFILYQEKRKLGENDDIVSQMIREDSVEKFISYTNQINMNLDSKIKESHFETNSFLMNKEPTLIEYATFFGSIQIFQYLKLNNIKLTPSLWLYAIHSNNADLIHILEENQVTPKDKTYKACLIEAIKCHHNEIANYLLSKLNPKEFHLLDYLKYDNYERILSDFEYFRNKLKIKYVYDCMTNYPKIVDLLIRESYLNPNIKIILKSYY